MIINSFNKYYSYIWDYVIVAAVIILSIKILKFYKNKWRLVKLTSKLPGPRGYPIIGNALYFAWNKENQLFKRIMDIIMPYVDLTPMKVWIGSTLYIIITEPRDIEVVLNSQQALNKGSTYKFFYPFIGKGLISGSGKTWKMHRKMVTRLINHRILEAFIQVFNRRSKELVVKLIPKANEEVFDIFQYIEECMINIVCETVMGQTDANELHDSRHEFIQCTDEMYKIVYNRMIKIWLHPDWIFRMTSDYSRQRHAQKVLRDFTNRCINARKEEMLKDKIVPSLLQRLLEVNNEVKEMSDEELREEAYTIYIAAQDTLTLVSSFAILMLGIHENVQDKARAEIDENIGEGMIDVETLSKLKYIEMIIKETLRLFPIAPLMIRQLVGDLKLENCILPSGCQIMLALFATQRNAKFWDNPKKFLPERFAIKEHSKRHPYAFVPFSMGGMGCIGQKYAFMVLKTILASILQNYSIKTNVNFDELKLRSDISIRSVEGYKISLKLRENFEN